ncbi:hypothetical protein EVAR_43548_1 [Eumeta japonica]|uniref:Uncharacterized protein n=1 Tax=Eumeta variegata TaxID=151549 RepID=A0A4C1WCJ5_EUMVA|nr:hypothetical protein EVAR_43548_1 [Eumeta japonica]
MLLNAAVSGRDNCVRDDPPGNRKRDGSRMEGLSGTEIGCENDIRIKKRDGEWDYKQYHDQNQERHCDRDWQQERNRHQERNWQQEQDWQQERSI